MTAPLSATLHSADAGFWESVKTLTSGSGVFAMEVNGEVTYVSSAPNLQRRVARVAGRLRLATDGHERRTVEIFCWETQSKLGTSLLLYQLTKRYFPGEYLQRVHLRMPWFVGLLTRDSFPRLITANRIPPGCDPVIGPFARRDLALLYEQEVLSAFALRRCVEVLSPSPDHPGCIYGEMKQCLRPCQAAVDTADYLMEAAQVSNVLRDAGGKIIRELTRERDAAINATNFEAAARLHKKMERLQNASSARDVAVANVDSFSGWAIVRAGKSERLQVFAILYGYWRDSVDVDISGEAPSLEHVKTLMQPLLQAADSDVPSGQRNLLEDLAIFARWYYSSSREGAREGVWIPIARFDDPPYRKLARTIQSLARAERAGRTNQQ